MLAFLLVLFVVSILLLAVIVLWRGKPSDTRDGEISDADQPAPTQSTRRSGPA
jgi:hypothetical protein